MEDQEKSKEQLIDELQDLRARLADLESESPTDGDVEGEDKSRLPRFPIATPIIFVGGFSLIYAQGINLSEGGVCFEISELLPFELEFDVGDEIHKHAANLMWMNRLPTGRSRLGFEFQSSDSTSLLEAHRKLAPEPSDG